MVVVVVEEKDEAAAGPDGRRMRRMGWPFAFAPSYSRMARRAEVRVV